MIHSPLSEFVEARTRAQQERNIQQERATRTVADNALDDTDLSYLLSMLGLDEPMPLSGRLAVYVDQVAAAIGVPAEATEFEVTDTATARIGLGPRCDTKPGQDLVLKWSERLGWYVSVEATPAGDPLVMAYLYGDAVPAPATVAEFVADTADGRRTSRIRPVMAPMERTTLAEKMATVCPAPRINVG